MRPRAAPSMTKNAFTPIGRTRSLRYAGVVIWLGMWRWILVGYAAATLGCGGSVEKDQGVLGGNGGGAGGGTGGLGDGGSVILTAEQRDEMSIRFCGGWTTSREPSLPEPEPPIPASFSCEVSIPPPPMGEPPIDPHRTVVIVTEGSGQTRLLLQDEIGACTEGWRSAADNLLELCPDSCDRIRRDPGAEVEVWFACLPCSIGGCL